MGKPSGLRDLRLLYGKRRYQLLAWLLFSLALVICLLYIQGFMLYSVGEPRLVSFVVALSPLMLLYQLLRLALPRLSTMALVGGATLVLSVANNIKIAQTTQPISWYDISNIHRLAIARQYLSGYHLLTLLAIAAILITLWVWETQSNSQKPVRLDRKRSLIIGATFCLSFFTYLEVITPTIGDQISSRMRTLGVRYTPWDRFRNFKTNGLVQHLVQTARPPVVPPTPTAEQRQTYQRLQQPNAASSSSTRQLVVILCESCWHGNGYFSDLFQPIRSLGFREWRVISPSYGGETVNASFELLTGLPSNHLLSGVIYDEYASSMRSKVEAIPKRLADSGSRTLALHNYLRSFWNRDLAKPKLGFDQYLGIEDMEPHNPRSSTWPSDAILTKYALKEIDQLPQNKPFFAFLITVFTHSSYDTEPIGKPADDGEHDYALRLRRTLRDLSLFAASIQKTKPEAAILIVGDHKPALSKFFLKHKIIPASHFLAQGTDNSEYVLSPNAPLALIGDVPIFFYHPNPKASAALAQASDHASFFCLGQALDRTLLHVNLPATLYGKTICGNASISVEQQRLRFPGWLYSLSLF